MEAAVGIVALVLGLVQFFGLDDAQRDTMRFSECSRLLHIPAREAWRVSEHGQHAVAQNAMCCCGEEG